MQIEIARDKAYMQFGLVALTATLVVISEYSFNKI